MAFDFTNFTTFHAKRRSRISVSVGARRVTTSMSPAATAPVSRSWTSSPPATRLKSNDACGAPGSSPHSSTRTFSFAANGASAAAPTRGAMTTSTNCRSTMAAAVCASSGRLNAMMPPNAEVGSVLNARS